MKRAERATTAREARTAFQLFPKFDCRRAPGLDCHSIEKSTRTGNHQRLSVFGLIFWFNHSHYVRTIEPLIDDDLRKSLNGCPVRYFFRLCLVGGVVFSGR